MVFELDLYEWPSFMFARRNTGHFSPWDGELMQICDFRVIASAHAWIDIGRAAIDSDASELGVTTAPLTVEADGEGAITSRLPYYPWQRFGGTSRWDNLFADLSYWRWYLVRHGTLSHVSPCEVTL